MDFVPRSALYVNLRHHHHLAQQRSDDAAALLCAELNETQTVFPRTDMRMVFELGNTKMSAKGGPGSEVGSIAKS